MPSSGSDFFQDVDELKNETRKAIRDGIQTSINKALTLKVFLWTLQLILPH